MQPPEDERRTAGVSRRSVIKTTAVAAVGASAFAATPASAELELVERSTVEVGDLTITFDSSFTDEEYSVGDTLTVTVNYEVEGGDATYEDFVLRGPGYTPGGPFGADGTEPEVLSQEAGAVEFEFEFTDLLSRGPSIGTGHFGLVLDVPEDETEDGDGDQDDGSTVGTLNEHGEEEEEEEDEEDAVVDEGTVTLGVDVHVLDPDEDGRMGPPENPGGGRPDDPGGGPPENPGGGPS